jgi:type VI secretion system secreted protein Hcp
LILPGARRRIDFLVGLEKWIGRPSRAVAFVAVGAAGAGAAIAIAAVPDSSGVIHACVLTINGEPAASGAPNVRIIDPGANPAQTCSTSSPTGAPGEQEISWNTVGQQGAQGVPGAQGLQGPQGAEGHTLTINGQSFSISGLKQTGTIDTPGTIAPLAVKPGGRPVGSLTGLDLGGGAPSTIEVDSWSFGASQTSTAGRGSGGGSGKQAVHDIQITKSVDKASPLLFKACASGQHFKKVTLSLRKAGGTQPYLTITMSNVLISSYQQSNGGGKPTESVSLNFTKIEFKNSAQNGS